MRQEEGRSTEGRSRRKEGRRELGTIHHMRPLLASYMRNVHMCACFQCCNLWMKYFR